MSLSQSHSQFCAEIDIDMSPAERQRQIEAELASDHEALTTLLQQHTHQQQSAERFANGASATLSERAADAFDSLCLLGSALSALSDRNALYHHIADESVRLELEEAKGNFANLWDECTSLVQDLRQQQTADSKRYEDAFGGYHDELLNLRARINAEMTEYSRLMDDASERCIEAKEILEPLLIQESRLAQKSMFYITNSANNAPDLMNKQKQEKELKSVRAERARAELQASNARNYLDQLRDMSNAKQEIVKEIDQWLSRTNPIGTVPGAISQANKMTNVLHQVDGLWRQMNNLAYHLENREACSSPNACLRHVIKMLDFKSDGLCKFAKSMDDYRSAIRCALPSGEFEWLDSGKAFLPEPAVRL